MRTPKSELIMCPQCTELRAPSYFARYSRIDGQYRNVDKPFKTCKMCRMRGVKKACGEFTTYVPSTVEADKPQYWPVGNYKIYEKMMRRING